MQFTTDFYSEGLSLSVGFTPTFFTLNQMFFTPSTIESSAVSDIKVSPTNNQVIVKYSADGASYLYNNVDFDALLDFVCGEFKSIGKFVNAYCKGNMVTVIN